MLVPSGGWLGETQRVHLQCPKAPHPPQTLFPPRLLVTLLRSATTAPPSATAALEARSQAYRDSLREEENRKLQKMKEEQHQKSELLELKRQQQEEERTKTQQAEHRRAHSAKALFQALRVGVNKAEKSQTMWKLQPGGKK
ncbi:Epithelial-stromal interaction protein 1 [Pteropus alecto]|uniref:Epithelial-stromal interaction protein 1 n=1 Tax=Pteropus alecto TaxID=9402 RepID=L5KFC8_PTEAL|nr:Epithelial-stromal interaction protein 1 [Pteropus alecto]